MIADLAARISARLDSHGSAGVERFVAEELRPMIGRISLESRFREPGESCYRRHLVHVERAGRFSVLALVWRTGQASPVHSHTGWCVVGVLEGTVEEVRYRRESAADATTVIEIGRTRHGPSGVIYMPVDPDAIHRIANHSANMAVTLHVYGRDLSRDANSINRVIAA